MMSRSSAFPFLRAPRVSGLFLKIFFGVWAATTVAGIVLLAIETERSEYSARQWRRVLNESFAFYAVSAAKEHEDEQARGSRDFLTDLQNRTGIYAWLFDEQGREVSGHARTKLAAETRRIREPMQRLSQRSRSSGQAEFERVGEITLAVCVAQSPGGRRYALVGELPALRFGLWYARPSLQALRLLAVLLMAGLISWVLSRHIATPIEKLRAATQRLADGDLSARTSSELGRRGDELGQLSHDFDAMAERIEVLLSEQERMMDTQRRFLRDISHELRSPLARLGVALELARDRVEEMEPHEPLEPGSSPPVEQSRSTPLAEVHDRIEHEAARLNEMIDRLLALARLESGVQRTEDVPVDLVALVRDILADADFEAQSKSRAVSLTVSDACATDGCLALGSRELLGSAIENVVRNALRYTPENTTVEVHLKHEQSEAVITVRDYGPGVPEEEIGDLFQPFFRTGRAHDRDSGGTGLGLAITERAIRLHGGSVQASNVPEYSEGAGGLIVELRLPLTTSAARELRDDNHS